MKSILTNEKYKGDALLQKTFCTDFLTKKMKVNEGEVPQYYVENSHPAIITPEVFDAVQAEMKRRSRPGRRNYTPHCFSGRIYCNECGGLFGSKVWNSRSRYKTTVWQCNEKYHGQTACATPSLRTQTIEDAFVRAINQIIDNKDEIISICETVLDKRCDTSSLVAEQATLQTEMEVVSELMQRQISMNAHMAMDQAEYQRQFDEYADRFEKAKCRMTEVGAQREVLTAKRGQIMCYLKNLREQVLITQFDEALWCGTVDQVRVTKESKLRFIFKDGTEIEIA